MILDIETWIYGKLNGDATLTTALTGGQGIVLHYPNDFETLPVLTYAVNQSVSAMDIWDNVPNANDTAIVFDIYTKNSGDPRPIETALDTVMVGLFFNLDYRENIGDESAKTQHITLRYTKEGILSEELV